MQSSYSELIGKLRQKHLEVAAETVEKKLANIDSFALVDVREVEEYQDGMIPGSIHLSRGFLEIKVENEIPEKNSEVILYCGSGIRSLLASETLKNMGYTKVSSMTGGFQKWKSLGFRTEKPVQLKPEHLKRYTRHISIPEVGVEGQQKLFDSKVLIIGAGGLGCPSAYYLAAAGVGTLGIVDDDVVEESNLQRQVLHNVQWIGSPKVDSARNTLKNFNPGVNVITYQTRLSKDNVEEIFQDYDIILDGTDNFRSRYLINDACVKLNKPCIHGSVFQFDGHVSVFDSRKGPCYRCLYPEPPPSDLSTSCAEGGVLGVLPGVIGLLEAVETVKIILEIGSPLIGRLLVYNALEGEFSEYPIEKKTDCACCASDQEFSGYAEYDTVCKL